MQHTTLQHQGAWTFGDSQRTDWYILKNKEIPGPGTHHDRMFKTSTSWTMGKSNREASFIPPHTNAPVGTYDPNIDITRPDRNKVTIGNSLRPNIPESITKEANYQPQIKAARQAAPAYTLGYSQPTKYDNGLPGPDVYNTARPETNVSFNRTQNYFSKTDRPAPYGEEGKYPGVGKYHLQEVKKSGPHIRFGTGNRPGSQLCPDSPLTFYPIKSTIGREGKGFSMSDKLYIEGHNDDYPAPNLYYPSRPGRQSRIFTSTSNRSNLIEKELMMRPSPGDYNISGSLDRGVGFAKSPRPFERARKAPGPGTYNIKSPMNTTQGKMAWKFQKVIRNITPSAHDYEPNMSLTERRERQGIVLHANRVDFSKSMTKHIGPGDYQVGLKLKSELGKMAKSERPVIRSSTPGPGQYNLPTTIGRIPNYYKNLNRKIKESGETKTIKYDPKMTSQIRLTSPALDIDTKKQEVRAMSP